MTGVIIKSKKIYAAGLICLLIIPCVNLSAQNRRKIQKNRPADRQTDDLTRRKIDEAQKKGFAGVRNGDWQAAQQNFADALTVEPRNPLSLYGSALSLFNLNQISEAETQINLADEILTGGQNNRLYADVLVLSAVVSAVGKNNAAAIAKLEKAVRLVPDHFDAVLSLGRAYFGNGEIEKSVNAFRRAAAINPQSVNAKFFLATALERADNSVEALKIYREILRFDPQNPQGNLGLGVLLLKTEGDHSAEGLNAVEKALAANEKLYEGQIVLGKTLIRLNRAAEAVEHLRKAAELTSENPEPHFQLAIAYRKLGRNDEARTETEIVKNIHERRRAVTGQNLQ